MSRTERRAYASLADWIDESSRRARVVGPLVFAPDGRSMILEVRQYQPDPEKEPLSVAGDFTPPEPPTLRANPHVTGGIALRWSQNVEPDLAGYNLYRSRSADGRYSKLNRRLILEPFHLQWDTTAASEGVFYRVSAVDRMGNESALSAPASAQPPSPPGFVEAAVEGVAVRLRWEESRDSDFDSYTIYRGTEPEGPFAEIVAVLLHNEYRDTGVRPGGAYHYVVSAWDRSGNVSGRSSVASVEVIPDPVSADASRN